MTKTSIAPPSGKTRNISAWILQVLLALAFLGAAGAKLASVPMLVEEFNLIGLGQWLRYVTAIVEIIGVIALLTPRYSAFGALWLATTMLFAVLAHVLIMHNDPTPAIVLLILNLVVVWLRRSQWQARKYFKSSIN